MLSRLARWRIPQWDVGRMSNGMLSGMVKKIAPKKIGAEKTATILLCGMVGRDYRMYHPDHPAS